MRRSTLERTEHEVKTWFRPLSLYYPYSSRASVSQAIPRLVNRDLNFHQSRNELQIELKDLSKHARHLQREDWYHVGLNLPTVQSVPLLLIPWTVSILVFAGLYMGVDGTIYDGKDCGLVSSVFRAGFGTYFAFSLETCTTVGYGLPGSTNAFFEHCPAIQVVIYFQMVFSMLYNAFLFAFIFASISRVETRGTQVIFSNTAILKRKHENGPWIFQIRVTDVDAAKPVVEAHVRLYAKKGSDLFQMRTVEPNDDLGGTLFLSWPNTIRHEIDVHSPLHPPRKEPYRLSNGGLNLRNVDSYTGNIEQYCCPVCSETYGDMERLRNHVRFNQLIEKNSDGIPIEGSHQECNLEDFTSPVPPSEAEMKAFFPDEILCVVEGIDRIASGTFQSLQSYTVGDIDWGGEFSDCLFFSKNKTVMNLSQFHTVIRPEVESEDDMHAEVESEDDAP